MSSFCPGSQYKSRASFFVFTLSSKHSSNHELRGPARAQIMPEFRSNSHRLKRSHVPFETSRPPMGLLAWLQPAFQSTFSGVANPPVFCETIPPILLVQPSMLVEASGLVEPSESCSHPRIATVDARWGEWLLRACEKNLV